MTHVLDQAAGFAAVCNDAGRIGELTDISRWVPLRRAFDLIQTFRLPVLDLLREVCDISPMLQNDLLNHLIGLDAGLAFFLANASRYVSTRSLVSSKI